MKPKDFQECLRCKSNPEQEPCSTNCVIGRLRVAIETHRAQKADDRCIEDDDRLYAVLNDGIKCDRRVGSRADMLENCRRFILNRCEGGGWPSYVELEAKLESITFDEVVHRICDPGAYLPRGDSYQEPITSWSARAVVALVEESPRPIDDKAKSAALSLFNIGALDDAISTDAEIHRVAGIIASAMRGPDL